MRTIYNYVPQPSDIETVDNTEESRVVPNCSLSVRQILERFRRTGVPDEFIDSRGYYDDSDNDIDVPVPEILDITDLSEESRKISTVLDKVKEESSKVKENVK